MVPALEGRNAMGVGRFGWKNQHRSLESFSADAYLNEMGITSPLFPDENTSSGRFVGFGTRFDPLPEPEDEGEDVAAFANFMRSTKAPARGRITRDVIAGELLFSQVGCNGCHVSTMRTAPLWALRTRNRLMHDGLSFTKQEADRASRQPGRRRARQLRCADHRSEEPGAHVPGFALSLPTRLKMGTFLISSPSRERLNVRGGK